jgi:hypothetical protein
MRSSRGSVSCCGRFHGCWRVVCGTSRDMSSSAQAGSLPADYAELDQLARDRGVDVITAGNFSIMAAVTTEIVFGGAGERLVMLHDPGESPEPYVGGHSSRHPEGCGRPWPRLRIGLPADQGSHLSLKHPHDELLCNTARRQKLTPI